ncbi:hypothetical protein WR25_18555 isoform E [Diploscapter pachys]|uniref:CX domain-containing protein n=1 Tax=Diploscapter pachys TaxID=2018661 RepID=A0A2A2LRH8_9BILA|nr:hypothetical protein WR25_18555 isoform C [Diploscapter pachys]PAV88768.1 hypothetical protein WR25_18555 isoform E [Diploscapter pachys]
MEEEPQPTFSLWTPISFDEAESPNDERRIRLKKRPNQMYYLENRIRHGKGGFSPKKGVCRLKVTPIDLLTTTDITVKHRAQSLPVYFYCPRYCCGLDCCELNGSFLAATLGTFAAVLVILSIVCNLECTRSRMRNVWRRITRV